MIITINHVHQFKYCSKGARAFFKAHQLDWEGFLKNGIAAEKLAATNDVMALNLIKIIEEQEASNGCK